MKNRALYAREIKRFCNRLKRSGPKPVILESEDPIEHLMFAVLSENHSPVRARSAVQLLVEHTVDFNDLRVSTAQELAGLLSKDLPDSVNHAAALIQILNGIYEQENAVTMMPLKGRSKKDVRTFLEKIEGMNPYILSATMLWGFGEHNVPIDQDILEVLAKESLIDPEAPAEEVEGFLKRQIPASESARLAASIKRYASQKKARTRKTTKKKKKKSIKRRTASRR